MNVLRKALRTELAMWRSLYRWVLRRRPAPGAGAEEFGYTASASPVLWTFVVVSAIEVPAVHLILPWPTARRVLDVLGIYGLIWMLGFVASLRVHPHVVDAVGLRIRHGLGVDVVVPWDAVAAVTARNRALPSSRSVQFERTGDGLVASVPMLSQTNVEVELREPTVLALPKGDGEPVIGLRLHADDPKALVARARARLTDRPGAPRTR